MPTINRQLAKRLGLEVPKGAPRIRRAAPERRTYNGVRYDSWAEACRAADLDLLKGFGEIMEWFRPKQPLMLAGSIPYLPDFGVYDKHGRLYYEEVKPRDRRAVNDRWPLKRKLWADGHGPFGVPLKVLSGVPGAWSVEIIQLKP